MTGGEDQGVGAGDAADLLGGVSPGAILGSWYRRCTDLFSGRNSSCHVAVSTLAGLDQGAMLPALV
jgi:hypothetical protein